MYALDILDESHTLFFQKSGEVAEREGMPLDGLWAVVLATVIEDVLSDGCTDRAFGPLRRTFASARRRRCRSSLLLLFARRIKRHRNTSGSDEAFTEEAGTRIVSYLFAFA